MTLVADASEEMAVEADPVKALMGADRDGWLVYHGFVAGERYDVTVAGQRRDLPAAEVLALVERLRALRRMTEAGVPARLTELHGEPVPDTWSIIVDGSKAFDLPARDVLDWVAGYLAAWRGRKQKHAGVDQMFRPGGIAELLDSPTADEQRQMVLLGLMNGGPQVISANDLIALMRNRYPGTRPPVKKTVISALAFGRKLMPNNAEIMIEALGYRWVQELGPAAVARLDGQPVGELPEMPGLVILRRIMEADRAGWLRYVGDPDPNKARWTQLDPPAVTIGPSQYELDASAALAWLAGVGAFHQARE